MRTSLSIRHVAFFAVLFAIFSPTSAVAEVGAARPAVAQAVAIAEATATQAHDEATTSSVAATTAQAIAQRAEIVAAGVHEHRKSLTAERERAAVEELAQAREREEQERDQTLRELRSREREVAEVSLQETRAHAEQLAEIDRETNQQLERVADRKAKLLDELDAVPIDASESVRRQQVDPLFDRVLKLRSEAHERFRAALASANEAERRLSEAASNVETAERQLDRDRERMNELESSAVWERRVALAKARLELAKQRRLHASEILAALRERVRAFHSQFGFFAGTMEPLLERISKDRRDSYFSLGRSANWAMAIDGVTTGVRALEQRVEHRLDQLDASNVATIEFWAWIWGLLWRLIGILLLAYIGLEVLIWCVDRICAGLVRRRIFRRNAAFFVKLAEMLRAVSKPTFFYVGFSFIAKYASQTIPELLGLAWIVDAIFIYWVIMQGSRVAILPRSHRREEGEASAVDLDYIEEARADELADITGVDLPRARKLLRSIRVVTVFWLFAAYLPDFIKPVTGITVFWWLVDTAATWGFIAVVYWVLSRWRDEIANLFEKIAGERLAPAVAFVQRHKERPWGVLVIAVTSLYVLFKEIAIVARRYLLDTDAFKKLNALAFRTQIEMQNRSREAASGNRGSIDDRLEDDYLAFFDPRPLTDEPYRIERDTELDQVLDRFAAWRQHRRRGSVAVVGEAGVGKTTFLHVVRTALAQADPAIPIVEASPSDRIRTTEELLVFLARVFEIDDVPEDVPGFLEAIRARTPSVVVLDDCHRMFSRHIEHFDTVGTLLEAVQLADSDHFFVLAFAGHAWRYVDRVTDQGHSLGDVVELRAWTIEELQALVERRNAESGYSASFASLVAAHEDTSDNREMFDVIETARGYFGYLHEYSGGIPRVAMLYWLESLHPSDREGVLDVDLFERPDTSVFGQFTNDHWFILAALVQHGGLSAAELHDLLERNEGSCARALDLFADQDIVVIDPTTHRATITARFWRPVLRRLGASRFLYGA